MSPVSKGHRSHSHSTVPTEHYLSTTETVIPSANIAVEADISDTKKPADVEYTAGKDEERCSTAVPDSQPPIFKHKIIMLALCITVFAVSLDTFIMTNTLPTIADDFKISDSGFSWIGSAYMLSFGVVVPLWANVSNVFGRRLILIITSVIFLLGTIIGACSRNIETLIVGRAVQGIGGGGLVVLTNIVVGDLFSVRERGLYFGVVGAVTAVASASGPTIGGVLAQKASWRWCFWILVPFNIISFVVLITVLKLNTSKIPLVQGLKKVDWLGITTIVGAALMLLLGLQIGATKASWSSALVILLITFGLLGFILFAIIEWKISKPPLMPLKFFTTISTTFTLGVNVAQSFITTGCTYFLPLYFQLVLHASPTMSGVYFLPTTLVLAVFFVFVGYVVRRTGEYRILIQVGAAALLLSTGLFIRLGPYTDWPLIILAQITIGIGLGLTYQAPLIAFHAQIEESEVAAGTSIFQFLKTLTQAVSVIFGQVIFQSQCHSQLGTIQQADLPKSLTGSLSAGNVISAGPSILELDDKQQALVRAVLSRAFDRMWIFYTIIAFLGLLCSFGIKKVKL